MRTYLFIGIILLVSFQGFSQEQGLSNKEKRKLEKELKKEHEAELAEQKAVITGLMVEYQRFVLEAEKLRDKRGNSVNVPAMINFIASDSINGVIQIGSDRYVGLNGVGGITIEGPISQYKYTYSEKNGSYNVNYQIQSSMGTYFVRMLVQASGRADATVSSSWPGKVNYLGDLVPLSQSSVYKGTSY